MSGCLHEPQAYFGKTEYGYGRSLHKPCNYPDVDHPLRSMIKFISDQLNDPTFNTENITCLATLYEDGSASIPMHSDNEQCIVRSSNIITVSLGASRELTFRSKVGPERTQSLHLTHGQVHVMTRQSQDFWEHGVPSDPRIKSPRVSLTFRRLTPSPPAGQKRIPPIKKSTRSSADPTPSPTKQVLFLTDSVHSSTPTHLFPKHLPCTKELLFQLSDLHDFEHLFPHMGYVVISTGINDLSRYNHRSYSLYDTVSQQLRKFCERYPDTVFIFNSLLLTQYTWLTPEIDNFNRAMFELSFGIKNLWFFDSHRVCQSLRGRGCRILDPDGNGIHILLPVKREITHCLVSCIRELDRRSPSIQKMWPMRSEFVSILNRQ